MISNQEETQSPIKGQPATDITAETTQAPAETAAAAENNFGGFNSVILPAGAEMVIPAIEPLNVAESSTFSKKKKSKKRKKVDSDSDSSEDEVERRARKKKEKKEKKERKKKKAAKRRKMNGNSSDESDDDEHNAKKARSAFAGGFSAGVIASPKVAATDIMGRPIHVIPPEPSYPKPVEPVKDISSQQRQDCCRVWIGNLLRGEVDKQCLQDFVSKMFNGIPDYQDKYKDLVKRGQTAIKNVEMAEDATGNARPYAFIEFWNEELATTCMEFAGADLLGRPIKTGRPAGYVADSMTQPKALDVAPLREANLLPKDKDAAMQNNNGGVTNVQVKKQRELYFGNLPVGKLNTDLLKEILSPALLMLPEYNSNAGSAIISVNWANPEGKFCFVEFQNEALATAALPCFNNMDIFGRKIRCNRPSGYIEGGVQTIEQMQAAANSQQQQTPMHLQQELPQGFNSYPNATNILIDPSQNFTPLPGTPQLYDPYGNGAANSSFTPSPFGAPGSQQQFATPPVFDPNLQASQFQSPAVPQFDPNNPNMMQQLQPQAGQPAVFDANNSNVMQMDPSQMNSQFRPFQ